MSIRYMGKTYGSLSEDKNGIINTADIYTYYFNNAESPLDILADSNLPARMSRHPSGNGLYAIQKSISTPQEGDECKSGKYEVTVSYTNDVGANTSDDKRKEQVAPWRLPPYNISISPVDVTVAFQKAYAEGDVKGSPSEPVLNSAGDPFDAQVVQQNTVYSFSYNLRNFNDSWIENYVDTINEAAVSVIGSNIPTKKGRLRNLSSSFQRIYDDEGGILYKFWQINVEVEKSSEEWKTELMDLGLWFLKSDTKYRIYTDSDGNFNDRQTLIDNLVAAGDTETEAKEKVVAVDTPQKLDGSGALYTGSTAEYITFYNRAVVSWAALSLPPTVTGIGSSGGLL